MRAQTATPISEKLHPEAPSENRSCKTFGELKIVLRQGQRSRKFCFASLWLKTKTEANGKNGFVNGRAPGEIDAEVI